MYENVSMSILGFEAYHVLFVSKLVIVNLIITDKNENQNWYRTAVLYVMHRELGMTRSNYYHK